MRLANGLGICELSPIGNCRRSCLHTRQEFRCRLRSKRNLILITTGSGTDHYTTTLAREIWDAHHGEAARVSAIAARIREGIAALDFSIPTAESLGVSEALEGRVLTYQHVRRERDPRLTRRKKEQFQDENRGRLFCEVCAFDYEVRYGAHGRGFIEAHHVRPLSELPRAGGRVRLEDLILLCASCHRMIHRSRPWLTPEALRFILHPFENLVKTN